MLPTRMQEPTADTIRSASHGDPEALDALIVTCLPRLRAYVRLHMGPALRAHESTEDVAQSVCREVIEDVREGFEYRGKGAFLRWLFSCALNKIRDRHRYRNRDCRDARREQHVFDGEAAACVLSPSRHAMGREDLERLNRAFTELRPEEQEVIFLTRFVGLDHKELGDELGIQGDAARMRIGRAMSRLVTLFDRQGTGHA